ncbi:PRSR2 protein, partial [Eudromia elegans]|nr:PRSR2 protein [Eudromia elegans]
DDEGLKYLTHEEKDVLMFFEETIDALDDALEEPALPDSGLHSQSPRSTEENVSSHSETEDIIDLVQSTPDGSDHEDPPTRDAEPGSGTPWKRSFPWVLALASPGSHQNQLQKLLLDSAWRPGSPKPSVPAELPSAPPAPLTREMLPPPPPPPPALPAVQHPKLLRSVPTPLIVAQKMSEQQGESGMCLPSAPKEGDPDRKRSPVPNGDHPAPAKHPPAAAPRAPRFPSNINITNVSGREFSETISRAAVNVQERRAQVLANITGGAFLAAELEEKLRRKDLLGRNRSSSLRDLPSEQTRYEALTKLGLVKGRPAEDRVPETQQPNDAQARQANTLPNGYQNIHEMLRSEPSPFLPLGKTVAIKPEGTLAASKVAQQNPVKEVNAREQPAPGLDIMRRRAGSLPRPAGLRPQGVTVRFSGRGSTEEARREALRKLGLLKETA